MKNFRRILTAALVLVLCLGLAAPGLAAENDFCIPFSLEDAAASKADALNALGLFKGTDKGYELEKGMTRLEALIMMIRLTGNEWNALYGEFEHPFTDAPDWEGANEYIGFGYENGLITGISATQLDPNSPASAQMFLTMLLRALGYTDGAKTVWENWEQLTRDAGLSVPDNSQAFLRGDMVLLCWAALDCDVQGTELTLGRSLYEMGYYNDLSLALANVLAGDTVSEESELMDIAGALYAGVEGVLPSRLAVNEINADNMEFFLGVDDLKISEGIAIEPMMTSSAHSVSIIRMKNERDVEKAKEAILANVNPYKWICVGVEPEGIRIDSIGNMICLVMDNFDSQKIMDNFLALKKAVPDAKGMMYAGGYYMEEPREFNEQYVERFAKKLQSIRDEYIDSDSVYYAVVPDKTYYARDMVSVWADHQAIMDTMADNLPGWKSIDLTNTLELSDYYVTDAHWRQEKLGEAVAAIQTGMGLENKCTMTLGDLGERFIGAYSRKVESLTYESFKYVDNPAIKGAKVDDFQHPELTSVYNLEELLWGNPYDFFLNGATPLQTITNPNADTDRELVLFRDSFGSSIAPLLLESYAKITLVDLRYMASALLPEYVSFENADVLFMYSDAFINNLLLIK